MPKAKTPSGSPVKALTTTMSTLQLSPGGTAQTGLKTLAVPPRIESVVGPYGHHYSSTVAAVDLRFELVMRSMHPRAHTLAA